MRSAGSLLRLWDDSEMIDFDDREFRPLLVAFDPPIQGAGLDRRSAGLRWSCAIGLGLGSPRIEASRVEIG